MNQNRPERPKMYVYEVGKTKSLNNAKRKEVKHIRKNKLHIKP